jgi:hypothetical protein
VPSNADYRNLQLAGLAIKEEAENARRKLHLAVIHSQKKRKAAALDRSRPSVENVTNER